MSKRVNLRYLGTVRSVTPMGLIVVSTARKKPVPLGSKVYYRDEDGVHREVGVIVDIIGNVEKPHAVVKVSDRDLVKVLRAGTELSYEPRVPRSHRGSRRRG